jgi:tRNA-specific 2-thiouridylase
VGTHAGVAGFTVGQRKGLGMSTGDRRYVLELSADDNRVVVGPAAALERDRLQAADVNFIACEAPVGALRVEARIRHAHTPAPATVRMLDAATAEVVFDTPQRAITPGQSVVWYDGDLVIGGGVICR